MTLGENWKFIEKFCWNNLAYVTPIYPNNLCININKSESLNICIGYLLCFTIRLVFTFRLRITSAHLSVSPLSDYLTSACLC